MRAIAGTIILSLVWLAAGCVPSLNPLYEEGDVIFDGSLIGTWSEAGSRETWQLSSCSDLREYSLTHTDEKGKKGEFSAKLVRVGDQTFLDIVPIKPGFTQNDFYQGHFFSTHTFAHIVKEGSSIKMSVLEPSGLKEVAATNPNAISHQKIRGEVVLTASPKEIQRFLLANLNNREAFSEPAEMVRKKDRS
jgi:hypothetical protein